MKVTYAVPLRVPIEAVDLEHWVFSLSDADYQAASPAHRAAGVTVSDGVRGTVNVENIGGTLIIQHYREVFADRGHFELLSARSRGYLFHLIPIPIEVRWTMRVERRDADGSNLQCQVEFNLSPILRLLSMTIATGWFVRRHVRGGDPWVRPGHRAKVRSRTAHAGVTRSTIDGGTMLKVTALLVKRSDMTHDEFVDYHRNSHARTFMSLPVVRQNVRRYVQQHTIPVPMPGVPTTPYDGITELWFDDLDGFVETFTADSYLEVVRPDEEKFLDILSCAFIVSDEHSVYPPADQ